jgi:hypothetical protein
LQNDFKVHTGCRLCIPRSLDRAEAFGADIYGSRSAGYRWKHEMSLIIGCDARAVGVGTDDHRDARHHGATGIANGSLDGSGLRRQPGKAKGCDEKTQKNKTFQLHRQIVSTPG